MIVLDFPQKKSAPLVKMLLHSTYQVCLRNNHSSMADWIHHRQY